MLKKASSSELTGQIQSNLGQTILESRKFKFVQIKGQVLFKGEIIKNVKIVWGHLKIFFSRTTGPILTRLDTNHSWVKGIQVCSKEGDNPSPRGDNSERVKYTEFFLKIFFFRTNKPNSIKLGINYPWVKGIQVCSNKGQGPLQRLDNKKM
jgi:hypothetical protein